MIQLLALIMCATQSENLDNYFKTNHFQGSVLIAQHGHILFSKGYGLANIEHQVPNTPKTVFRVGSVTKSFTAIAILQLQEQGLLNVKDPIVRYLPKYPRGDKITIHHLLSHTSGIPSLTGFSNIQDIQIQPSNPEKVMGYFKDLPLRFEPGTNCEYSDSGYIVLGAILEAVSKQSYESYIRQHILTPLNMSSTYYEDDSIIMNKASGYCDKNGLYHAGYIDMSVPHGAGGLISTVEDLYKLDQGLKGDKLLSKESKKLLFTIHGNSMTNGITYGYGFFIDPEKGSIGHSGTIEGFRAAFYHYLEDDLTIILLSNFENSDIIAIEQFLYSWRI